MYRELTDFCPHYGAKCTVSTDYLDMSTLSEKAYIRGLSKCSFAAAHGCEHQGECELRARFPKEIK